MPKSKTSPKTQAARTTKAQATRKPASDSEILLALGRPIMERMRDMWWAAFTEQVCGELRALRSPETRAKVERAAASAHKVAATAYIGTYKGVFARMMDAQKD
jgi:hypothetical protein